MNSFAKAVSIWADPERAFTFLKGRVALYAILRAAGVGPGDEVLVPGFTCVVVPAAVCYTGAAPIYFDITADTFNGDSSLALNNLTERTKAVIVQHTFGTPAELGDLPRICRQNGIYLIEDCAHAIGATLDGKPVGTFGDGAFCSLQWSKPITTGLGGIGYIANPELAGKMRAIYASQFSEPSILTSISLNILSGCYRFLFNPKFFWLAQDAYRWAGKHQLLRGSSSEQELQIASMPDDYCQRFGRLREFSLSSAMRSLSGVLEHRIAIASIYQEALSAQGCKLPAIKNGSSAVHLRFPVLVNNRTRILAAARSEHLEIGDWFNAPLHPAEANAEAFGYRPGLCPNADRISRLIINLPTHRKITQGVAEDVIEFLLSHERDLIKD